MGVDHKHKPEVVFEKRFPSKPFVVWDTKFMTVAEFKAFYQDCREAMQAYEAEKIADDLYRKTQAEVSRKRR